MQPTPENTPVSLPSSPPAARSRWLRFVLVSGGLLGVTLALLWGWLTYRNRLERAEALKLFRAGRFPEAESLLRRTLARLPDDVESLQALVEVVLAGQDPLSAEPLLKQWCELRPGDAQPWKHLLELYKQQHKHEQALDCARAILEREPDNQAMQRRLAELLVSSGRFEDAERACQACLDQQPGERGLLLLLAAIKRGQERNDEAEAILNRLLAEHPDYVPAQMAAGVLYRETGRFDKAIPLLEQVLRRDRRRARAACYQLTMALEQAGRHDEAQRAAAKLRYLQDAQILRELLESQPNDLDLKVRLAEMLLKHDEVEEGSRLLHEALKQDPEFQPARQLRDRYLKN
jgi:predicted Zn-dependent protease